jgi:hypothetical protein
MAHTIIFPIHPKDRNIASKTIFFIRGIKADVATLGTISIQTQGRKRVFSNK